MEFDEPSVGNRGTNIQIYREGGGRGSKQTFASAGESDVAITGYDVESRESLWMTRAGT